LAMSSHHVNLNRANFEGTRVRQEVGKAVDRAVDKVVDREDGWQDGWQEVSWQGG
jgi:hypothetical protein